MALSIQDFIRVYNNAIRGVREKNADTRRGSELETLGGFTAVMWSRETQRDDDLFRDTRFADASGDELTQLVKLRYGIDRILDTKGTGVVTVSRSSGSPGTFWKGTRIRVFAGTGSVFYEIAADTAVTGNIANVPIEASATGLGFKADTQDAEFYDPLWDNTWRVVHLTCSDGTVFETADQFRARVKDTLFKAQPGKRTSMIEACKSAGATEVILFESDYGGNNEDRGFNVCYVDNKINDVKLALEKVRVAGDNIQVLPLVHSTLAVEVNVYLNDSPILFDIQRMYRLVRDGIVQSVKNTFQYNRGNIAGNIYRAVPNTQEVEFVTPSSDVSVLSVVGGLLNFPDTLTRYTVNPTDVIVNFKSPK